jgi:hypothetical protein
MSSVSFRISSLPLDSFHFLFGLNADELAAHNARRCIADSNPGFPCRVSLEEAEVGESVILLNYVHHPVNNPYRSAGPIYVRERAKQAELKINEVPQVAQTRVLSVRAYDESGFLVASDVVDGSALKQKISDFFSNATIAYLHLHNARPGCYSCRVDRA